jgi:hypothetical protein
MSRVEPTTAAEGAAEFDEGEPFGHELLAGPAADEILFEDFGLTFPLPAPLYIVPSPEP